MAATAPDVAALVLHSVVVRHGTPRVSNAAAVYGRRNYGDCGSLSIHKLMA